MYLYAFFLVYVTFVFVDLVIAGEIVFCKYSDTCRLALFSGRKLLIANQLYVLFYLIVIKISRNPPIIQQQIRMNAKILLFNILNGYIWHIK